MKEKINHLLKENEKITLNEISKKLGISYVETLRNAPTCTKYPVEEINYLFDTLREWENVLLLVMAPNFVLEIKDKFPQGFLGHGFYNFHDKNSSIGGHLSIGNIKEIFFVEDIMFGLKSCSIKFFSEDEKEIFAIYVPRDEKKQLINSCLNSFNALKNKY